ncbi:hypothetical protein FRC00_009588 [Tulasnella sp. 408]|nr:hypothetical protein FRC00_009588 [Tulasnella sp. 408]
MPAARTTPSSAISKKHSHSATPPSSTSGDEMSQPPKKLQKTDAAKAAAAGAANDDKLKRKRQSQSCDACRARKVRCARPDPPEGQAIDGEHESFGPPDRPRAHTAHPPPEDSNGLIPMTTGPDGSKQVAQCKHCIALGIKCTYDYQPKKRGPPNL